MVAASGAPDPTLEISRSLTDFVEVWENEPSFSFHIISPMFEQEQRLNALLAVARALNLDEIAQRFLKVVFERDRITALADIVDAYRELAEKKAGIVHVRVKTATSLDDQERFEIEARLRSKIQGILVFEWVVDPDLLGGLVVLYEGKILDASLSTKFNQLFEVLQ